MRGILEKELVMRSRSRRQIPWEEVLKKPDEIRRLLAMDPELAFQLHEHINRKRGAQMLSELLTQNDVELPPGRDA